MNKFILEGSYHSGLYGNGLQGERVEQNWKQTFGGGSQDDLYLGVVEQEVISGHIGD